MDTQASAPWSGQGNNDIVVNAGEKPLRPRQVKFDFTDMAGHWLPSDIQSMHTINVLHLMLPKTEGWFIRMLRTTMGELNDQESRDALRGLLGQESVHSRIHGEALAFLEQKLGFDSTEFTKALDYIFERVLAEQPFGRRVPERLKRPWFLYRVAICGAIEHYTAFIGAWGLEAEGLDRCGADPRMLDLLRWHCAEEVEHRGVAFDVGTRVGTHWGYRAAALLSVTAWVVWLFYAGTRFLMSQDTTLRKRATWPAFFAGQRRGILPPLHQVLSRIPVYLQPGYHPRELGSMSKALAYLESSAGVLAGQRKSA
jgi:predicted metal-dependent hydrolase